MARLILDWRGDDLPLAAAVTVNHVGDVYDTAGGGLGQFEQGNYTTVDLAANYTFDQRAPPPDRRAAGQCARRGVRHAHPESAPRRR